MIRLDSVCHQSRVHGDGIIHVQELRIDISTELMIRPKVSVFSLPLLPWQQTPSVRVQQYDAKNGHKRGRKRRRSSHDSTDTSDDRQVTEIELDTESNHPVRSLVLTPEEIHQYRVAGLSLDQELPGGHFPHAAIKDVPRKHSKGLAEDLLQQSPPIYLPGTETKEHTLHVRHLGVLTSILYRCLLEGDLVRAGRAWGMLLHDKFGNQPVDIRSGGRWGIGAEILFRQNASGSSHIFTRPGFEAAKAYFERLVIQYPSRNARTDASSSLQFYPAMFSLWIYVVDQESKIAKEALEYEEDEMPSEHSAEYEEDISDMGNSTHRDNDIMSRLIGIRRKELAGAQEIASRMDEVMIGPPYSDSPALLRLRGMVALWVGDLYVSSLTREDEDTMMSDDGGLMSRNVSASQLLASRELHIALEKRAVEGIKAQQLFEKAKLRQQSAGQSSEDHNI